MLIEESGDVPIFIGGAPMPAGTYDRGLAVLCMEGVHKSAVSGKAAEMLSKISGAEGIVGQDASSGARTLWAIASLASSGLGAYHGYARNKSIGWGIWWALMGGIFPIITPAIAFAQGFGKPALAGRK